MALLDTLTSKSTEELKRYLTDEGYKDEAVELAINILRERGVNIDNELRDRQVAFCSQCKNRKLNPKEGIICALTGQKATFGTNCKDFNQDEEAPAKAQQHEDASEPHWGGFMYFYWFVLALGALLTIVGNFANFSVEDYSGSGLLVAFDVTLLVAYVALCIYTIVAFVKRRPNAVMLGKLQNFMLIGMNGLLLLTDGGAESGLFSTARMIGSVLWAVVFLIFLYTSENVNSMLPKSNRHMMPHDKPIIITIVIAIIAFYVGGIIEVAIKNVENPEETLIQSVTSYQAALPIENDDHIIKAATLHQQDSMLVLDMVSKTYVNDDLDDVQMLYFPDFTHELLLFASQTAKDTLIQRCYLADYGYATNWYDKNGDYTYTVTLSREDLNTLFDTVSYTTPYSTKSSFVLKWNQQLPTEYVGGTIYTQAEMNDQVATIHLSIQDVSINDLQEFTSEYLKQYLIENHEYLVDYFVTLAMLNQLQIVYQFSASCSLFWSRKVYFTPEEYSTWI